MKLLFDEGPLAAAKDPLTQTQYGASLGGPLWRSHTFLFSNFEKTHRHAAGIVTIAPANVQAVNAALDAFRAGTPPITTGEFPTGYQTTNYFVRIDHQLSKSQQLIARYSLYDLAGDNVRSVAGSTPSAAARAWTIAIRPSPSARSPRCRRAISARPAFSSRAAGCLLRATISWDPPYPSQEWRTSALPPRRR